VKRRGRARGGKSLPGQKERFETLTGQLAAGKSGEHEHGRHPFPWYPHEESTHSGPMRNVRNVYYKACCVVPARPVSERRLSRRRRAGPRGTFHRDGFKWIHFFVILAGLSLRLWVLANCCPRFFRLFRRNADNIMLRNHPRRTPQKLEARNKRQEEALGEK